MNNQPIFNLGPHKTQDLTQAEMIASKEGQKSSYSDYGSPTTQVGSRFKMDRDNSIPIKNESIECINFMSDTVTQPTEEMRQSMVDAPLGDDVYGDDPTVLQLQTYASKLVGKEASLFVPSGCMGNLIAMMIHAKMGETVIMADMSHLLMYEAASFASIGSVASKVLKSDSGVYTISDIEEAIDYGEDIHSSKTALLWVENPTSQGKVCSMDYMKSCYFLAKKHGLAVHLDCARLFNASFNLGVEPKEIAKYAESCMFCLSKGLCAPVGSMLCGTRDFIEKAKRLRKMMGGGMRQVGVLAAPGLIALKKHIAFIQTDNQMAMMIGKLLQTLEYVIINLNDIQINMVFFYIDRKQKQFKDQDLIDHMLKQNIKMVGVLFYKGPFRLMTHYYIREKEIERYFKHFTEFFNNL